MLNTGSNFGSLPLLAIGIGARRAAWFARQLSVGFIQYMIDYQHW